MRCGRPKHAFTLIELLVVISIIALLLAILMPALRRVKEAGKRVVCLSNQRQLSFSWTLYAADNDDFMCSPCPGWYGEDAEISWISWAGGWPQNWKEDQWESAIQDGAIWPYCDTMKIYRCPTGKPKEQITYASFAAMGWRESLNRPIDGEIYKRISQIPSAAQRSVFIDEGYLTPNFYGVIYNAPQWFDQPPDRHSLGVTMSFADAHAEYWKWKDSRTIDTCQMTWDEFATNWQFKDCLGNVDLMKMRIAAWGELEGDN